MNRFLAALALLLLALAGAAAQTHVNWGLATGSNPRNLCVYDATHVCVTTGALDSVTHTFTPVGSGLTVGTTTIAGGTNGSIEYNNSGVLGELATTGSGSVVRATSPTLVTPALGTPASGTLTNATGLPISTGVSGLGTGVATALAASLNATGGVVGYSGALGTPASGTLTNATGLPISTGVSGLGTGVATALSVNTGAAGSILTNGGALGTPSSGVAANLTGLPISTGVSGLGTGVATTLGNTAGATGGFAISYVASITALRAATWTGLTAPVAASLATNWYANDGGGVFVYDAADTTSADNSGTIIVTANGLRFKRQFTGAVNVTWFGAHPDWNGSTGTDNTAAIQAAVNALSWNVGGKVYLPYVSGVGGSYAFTQINAFEYTNLTIYGDGKGTIFNSSLSGFTTIGPTTLVCTRTDGADCINFYDANHCGLKDLEVLYTSTSYSGYLVDMSSVNLAAGAGYLFLDNVALKSAGWGMTNATGLVRFDRLSDGFVRNSDFYGAQYLVVGGTTLGQFGTRIHFDKNTFWNWQYAAIYNPGDSWNFNSNNWEMTSNSGAPAFLNQSTVYLHNLTLSNSNFEDAGTTAIFMHLWGIQGLHIDNTLAWGNGTPGATFLQVEGSSDSINITGGSYIYAFTNVFNFVGTSSNTVITGNKFLYDTNVVVNPQNVGNLYSFSNLGYPDTDIVGFRNRITNGGDLIDQRNGGAAQTIVAGAALAYTNDRFYVYATGANVTGQQVNRGYAALKQYQITGAASVTGVWRCQRVESYNSADLAGGSATFSVDLSDSLLTTVNWQIGYANSQDAFGTVASPTVTSISSGTFTVTPTLTRYGTGAIAIPSAATTGLQVCLSVGAQTSGNFVSSNWQLEPGNQATLFERRPPGVELALCQRYFQINQASGYGHIELLAYGATASVARGPALMSPMRATPTLAYANIGLDTGFSTIPVSSMSIFSGSSNFLSLQYNVSSGLTTGQSYMPCANNASAYISFSAEL